MKNIKTALIEELKKNSRISNVKLAKRLGISEGSVRNHITKLIKQGIIKRFSIELAPHYGFETIILVKAKSRFSSKILVNKIIKLKGIEKICEISGNYDLLILTLTKSPKHYNKLIESVRSIPGISSTESAVILESHLP